MVIEDMVCEDIAFFQEIGNKQMRNKGKLHFWTLGDIFDVMKT
jgi:hypothetical protein